MQQVAVRGGRRPGWHAPHESKVRFSTPPAGDAVQSEYCQPYGEGAGRTGPYCYGSVPGRGRQPPSPVAGSDRGDSGVPHLHSYRPHAAKTHSKNGI